MKRRGLILIFGSSALLVVACGLSVEGTGLNAAPESDASVTDAATTSDTFVSTDADDFVDASANDSSFDANAFDAGNSDGSACVDSGITGANGTMSAIRSTTTKTIDAQLFDWSACSSFFTLDSTTANNSRGTTTAKEFFALEWDDTGVYFAAAVSDPNPQGTDTNDPYKNDSVDLFLAGAPTDGGYNATTFHVIVDYKGLAKQYAGGPAFDPQSGFQSAAIHNATGYIVEMFVPKAAFGVSTLTAMTYGFDTQLNDNEGNPQDGVLWFHDPNDPTDNGICTAMTEPACDTYEYGFVDLLP